MLGGWKEKGRVDVRRLDGEKGRVDVGRLEDWKERVRRERKGGCWEVGRREEGERGRRERKG